jgi:oligopeptide transport system permease protein
MITFAIRRLLSTIPVLWIALTAAFFLLRLAPGGPFDGERPLPAKIMENIRAHYDLDRSLIEQYFLYIGRVVRGDLGPSFVTEDFTVGELIAIGMPFTFILGGLAFAAAIFFGVITGVLSALYQNRNIDYILSLVVMTGLIIPNFLVAPILQLVFGIALDWFPVGGWGGGHPANLVLPVTVLALPHIARISRLMRGSMIETLNANFIRTAEAKGLGARLVVVRHAIKPALIPVVSYLGPAAGFLLTGSLVVETIFGIPGIGQYFIQAALNRDYGMVLGTVIFFMVLIVMLNLVVDLIYAWLDPKVRYQ